MTSKVTQNSPLFKAFFPCLLSLFSIFFMLGCSHHEHPAELHQSLSAQDKMEKNEARKKYGDDFRREPSSVQSIRRNNEFSHN